MLFALFPAGEHRHHRHRHVDRRRGRIFGIEHDLTSKARKHAMGGGKAQVIVGKHNLAVAGVQLVFFRGSNSAGRGERKRRGEQDILHRKLPESEM